LEILNKRDFMNAEYSEIFPPNKKEPWGKNLLIVWILPLKLYLFLLYNNNWEF
jgi:hypothetical protein